LTITKSNNNQPDPTQRFEAMFNPSQYSVRYQNIISTEGVHRPGEKKIEASRQEPRVFSFQLTLDGTGATEDGLTTGLGLILYTVKERLNKFLHICYNVDEPEHRPNQIHVQWGILNFDGVLQSLDITYTLFDQSGNPLRANLDIQIVSTNGEITPRLSSPDLTHTRTVKAGDSLPLLAKEIYGSSRYYLLVAEANGLDDFRNVNPGTVLYFPPLTNSMNA
jgi:nucleoid-associated protein YgaU